MKDEQKKNFFTPQICNIFEKHHWHFVSNPKKNYHFNYKGEIADYYLMVSHNYNTIQFDYMLDIEVPKDKIYDLLILINFVNQKTRDGFFLYDLETNKIKFYNNKQYLVKLKNKILEGVIEENLNITDYLFRNFSLATHNLIYAEKIDQSYIKLMFSKIEGSA